MPFDYNSFLKGVITGMQLPRVPGHVVPPQPPVTSGKYILTETGVQIITEKVGSGLASFYGFGTIPEYFTTTGYASDAYDSAAVVNDFQIILWHYDSDFNPAPTNAQLFFWVEVRHIAPTVTLRNVHWVLLWQGSEYDYDYYTFSAADVPGRSSVVRPSSGQIFQAGDSRYITFSLALRYSSESSDEVYPRIDNAVMFEGTSEELSAFVAGLSGLPMITE